MADFIMTLDSDDDVPSQPLARPQQQPKKSKKPSKDSLKKLSKKKQQKKLKRVMDTELSDSGSSAEEGEDESALVGGGDGGVGKMDKGFVFDGLGGGFVGDRRNNVWDSGEAYIRARPNAMPRVTIDEIIARRAPEREAAKLTKETEALLAEGDDDLDDDDSDLEAEMMAELGGEASEDEDEEDEEDEEEFAGIGSSDDEEGLDSEQEKEVEKIEGLDEDDESEEEKEKAAEAEEEEDNWLGLGKVSDDEKEDDEDQDDGSEEESGSEEEEEDEEKGAVKGATSAFAALADMEDDDGDMSEEDAATAQDVQPSESALSKSFFTSHRNASTTSQKSLSFNTLPNATLSRQLLLALGSLNLSTPTPIQSECIPLAMMGKDIVASSATGSGKTVAFWVGVLERLLHRDRKNPMTRVVVMTPTRELAVQVHGVGKALARYTDVQFCLCVGGLSLKVQEAELKQRPDIVVSTPGRLIDHVRNTPCFTMDGVEVLVLDEADRMLEEGFRAELEEIITAAPRSRQTLLFSATVTESVSELTRLSMNKPVRVKIDEMGATAKGLEQEFLRVRGDKAGESIELNSRSGERHREALLISLCTRSFASGRTIIFFRSKAQAHRMKILFSLYGQGLERSDELHGDLTQEQRLGALKKFREGEIGFLLATDLASRGLDIKGIEHVINYEMPKSIEIYLHRVGRTARAGKKGRALTLVGESDRKLVKLAMKHAAQETIKQRTVPTDVVNAVIQELRDMQDEVKEVMREEREEKEFRKGNMEVQKAQNLLQHEAEIKSRPARTWFQTETEKKTARNLGTAEHNSKFSQKKNKRPLEEEESLSKAPKRTPFSGLSRKEKRRKMAAREDAEDRSEGVSQSIGASIRSIKKAARPSKMTYARPERPEGPTPKQKKQKKAAFDREMGVSGGGGGGAKGEKREGKRERALTRGENPDAEKKKKQKLGRMGPKQKRK
ncbi:DEAD/DEAH box helicase [Sporobolomyces salmoneus]|uniref:DEAD/DEAH box helicase n=1 Tax=Sporobolomyces salmoneus TaxID=183962 RepID=UPI00316CC292